MADTLYSTALVLWNAVKIIAPNPLLLILAVASIAGLRCHS